MQVLDTIRLNWKTWELKLLTLLQWEFLSTCYYSVLKWHPRGISIVCNKMINSLSSVAPKIESNSAFSARTFPIQRSISDWGFKLGWGRIWDEDCCDWKFSGKGKENKLHVLLNCDCQHESKLLWILEEKVAIMLDFPLLDISATK